jgi:hypothetical protein
MRKVRIAVNRELIIRRFTPWIAEIEEKAHIPRPVRKWTSSPEIGSARKTPHPSGRGPG